MGAKQSKEEIIIAQAGNSGGVTNSVDSVGHLTLWQGIGLVFFGIVMVFVILYCYGCAKKRVESKIRREIRRSQELV